MNRKKKGKRALAAIVARHRDALEAFLCNPRPDGLPAWMAWGIAWSFVSGASGGIHGAQLTLHCAMPRHIAPRNTAPGARGRYGAMVLTQVAWDAFNATCEAICKECGWGRGSVTPRYSTDLEVRDTPAEVERMREIERTTRAVQEQSAGRAVSPDVPNRSDP